MKQVRILVNGPSDGANNLLEELTNLGVTCGRLRNDKIPTKRLVVRPTVKWGCFTPSAHVNNAIKPCLNFSADDTVLNKMTCLSELRKAKVPCVDFTNMASEAQVWIDSGERVYCRTVLRGSGGEGITVAENSNQLVRAQLYTKGIKGKRSEYRIHVFNFGGVMRYFIQQKLRRQGFKENERYDSRVRNLDHGWIFAHNDITPPKEQTIGAAVAACEAFNLHFGAVDIIETNTGGQPYVLEINTAPGLEGGTATFYANCLKDAQI